MSHRDWIGKIYTDSLVHDPEALSFIIKIMGEDNVMLGSDYPFPLGEHHPGKLISDMDNFSDTLKVRLYPFVSTIL